MTDLKSCPFCGGEPDFSPSQIYDEYDSDDPQVHCRHMVRFSEYNWENKEVADQDLINKWNTRK